jgi:hypothetical protein
MARYLPSGLYRNRTSSTKATRDYSRQVAIPSGVDQVVGAAGAKWPHGFEVDLAGKPAAYAALPPGPAPRYRAGALAAYNE